MISCPCCGGKLVVFENLLVCVGRGFCLYQIPVSEAFHVLL